MSMLCDVIANHGGLIQTGPFGSQLHEYEYTDVGVPVVMPKDIVCGKINYDTVARISKGKADQLQRHKLQAGDIVFPRRGDIGKCAFVSKNDEGCLCGTGCLKITVPDAVLSRRFLFYFLGLPESVKWLENNSTGSTMMNLNTDILGRIEIPDLPIAQQRRIADILSAYDDLIENNRRRIAILEETARLAYRKWFGGEVGRTATLGEIAEVVMGQSPESKTYNSQGEGLPFHQGVTGFGFRYPSNEMWCTAGTCFAEEGDILFSVRAPVGRINVASERIVIGRGLSAMRARNKCQSWLLYTLKQYFSKEDMIGVGCIFASTTKKELLSVELPFPPEEDILAFERLASPIDSQIKVLSKQSAALAAARDMLLPRLMKGEVA